MRISVQSEWMKSQKQADVMAPTENFSVVQTPTGDSIFFSLGTDNVLYATREVRANSTGWTRLDLSSRLSSSQGGATVKAKAFALAQNIDTLAFDLALAVTIGNTDYLYLSLGNPNTDASFAKGVQWTKVPFDDSSKPSGTSSLTIADVYLVNLPNAAQAQTCFVDIWRSPPASNPLKLLDRYYILPNGSPHWHLHQLPIDLAAGSITSCLGRRSKDPVGGIYTYGTIGGTPELIYVPQYNAFRPNVPPSPARLAIPAGTQSIATSIDPDGHSHLFVSASDGLFYFTPDDQDDDSAGVVIVRSPAVASASELSAMTAGGFTVVWGLNPQRALFYTKCHAGSESDPSAWSAPMPLVSNVESYSFYANKSAGNSVLFAHISGQQIAQLTQDRVTGNWIKRQMLLPTTEVSHMVEFNGFTTRMEVIDDNGLQQKDVDVILSATSPVSVFVNDVYYVLSKAVSVTVKSDATGAITIIQQSDSLAVVFYQATIAKAANSTVSINPAAKALAKLYTIKDKESLNNAQVTRSDGTIQPLVPSSVPDGDRQAAAAALQQLAQISSGLPADGSRQVNPVVSRATSTPVPRKVLMALSASNGTDSQLLLHPQPAAAHAQMLAISVPPILVEAGDLFAKLGKTLEAAIKSLVFKIVNGIHEVWVQIGNVVYRALLDCVAAIVRAAEWVFDKIKVLVEDLIAFLGFLFMWKDIVRTHLVIKNVFKQFGRKAVAGIGNAETAIAKGLDGLQTKLNAWAGIPDSQLTVGSSAAQANSTNNGASSPQAHWGMEHAKSNLPNSTTSFSTAGTGSSTIDRVIADIQGLATDEYAALKTAVDNLQSQIMGPLLTLTPAQIFQRLAAIIGGTLIQTAKNVVVKSLDIIKILVDALFKLLDAPISIPVLSPFYKQITGSDLSFLDVMCFVAAIPVTIIYKIVTGAAPFPDNATTSALTSAKDFAALKTIVKPKRPAPSPAPAPRPQGVMVHMATATTSAAVDPEDVYKKFTIIGQYLGMVGSWATMAFSFAQIPFVDAGLKELVPAWMTRIAVPTTLLALSPFIIGAFTDSEEWDVIMTDVVISLQFLKTCVDASDVLGKNHLYGKVSPYIDAGLCVIGLVPTIGYIVRSHEKPSDYVGTMAVALNGLSGVPSPVIWNSAIDFLTIHNVLRLAVELARFVISYHKDVEDAEPPPTRRPLVPFTFTPEFNYTTLLTKQLPLLRAFMVYVPVPDWNKEHL
ncbi:MAG: hypothetical protein Q9203_002974 [Teloschistes exilis]